MVKGKLGCLLRGSSNKVAMDHSRGAQVNIKPGEFMSACGVQQLINPQLPHLRDSPGMNLLPSHPVLELPLPL